MIEGTVVEWLKKENESVKKGEPIAEISSEKIQNEIEAPVDGILLKILIQENATVPVATTIGYIGQPGEQLQESPVDFVNKAAGPQSSLPNIKQTSNLMDNNNRIPVSPAARKLASSFHINLENIIGTGPNGRITIDDIKKAAEEQKGKLDPYPSSLNNVAEKKGKQVKQVTGMRKTIAERMFRSLQETAQLTLMLKADVTELLQLQSKIRSQSNGESNVKVTVTHFIAMAAIRALHSHKQINSLYVKEEIHIFDEIHLGIAVALEEGLIVPVIHHAEMLSFREIASQIQSLGMRARQGDLKQADIQGSTFTITNMGNSGIEYFTPVLNYPETGILGVGTIQAFPVFTEDNQIVRREFIPLSLTFDHRIIDGEPAGAFLATVKNYLENPYSLLI